MGEARARLQPGNQKEGHLYMFKQTMKRGRYALLAVAVMGTTIQLQSPLQTASASSESVQTWLTTADQTNLLSQQAALSFQQDGSGGPTAVIQVDDSVTYQPIEGFGGTMTESSAWLIQNKMNAQQRDVLLNDLFTDSGIALNYLRQPIGASDFTHIGSYTYNDIASGTDYGLQQFDISKDADIISTFKQIQNRNNRLRIMGTPWTAPAWMKVDKTLHGSYLNYTDSGVYQALADYFVNYIEAYAANGLNVDTITIQNEPLHTSSSYPSMSMSAGEQRDFIKNYLGPTFAVNQIDTNILMFDHNWDIGESYASTVLSDPGAAQYVDGIAWHCYGATTPEVQSNVHNSFPSKSHYLSECSGGGWATNFGDNLKWLTQHLIVGSTRNWSRSILLYNIALDTADGPKNGGCPNCRGIVTINQANGAYTKNVEYYALGHVSKFVKEGAHRMSSTADANGVQSVGFKNQDESNVLVAVNTSSGTRDFKVKWGNQSFSYSLPASAVATFVWEGSIEGQTSGLQNGGFEAGNLTGWQGWAPSGQAAAHNVDSGGQRSGSYKLVHWAPNAYQQTTYQTISIENGTYNVRLYARSGGGQNGIQMQVNGYGGGQLTAHLPTGAITDYTPYSVQNLTVTTGQISVGIYSNGNANNWAVFDDIEIIPAS
jgi:glucosylceramidase